MTIDFTSLPDGTPIPGLIASILYLNAVTGLPWGGGSISSDGLAVVPFKSPAPDTSTYKSLLMAVFLRPVTEVSITAKCYRNAGCSLQGVDGGGGGFDVPGPGIPGSVDGNPPPTDWVTLQLPIPEGGYLTSFQISNRDPKTLDAAFWLKSITFSPQPLSPNHLHIVGAH